MLLHGPAVVIEGIAQRAGRAAPHNLGNLVGVCSLRIDPGLALELPNRRKVVGALAGMRAHRAVVVDGDSVPRIGFAPLSDRTAISDLSTGEAFLGVGSVAERLVPGSTTAAEENLPFSRDH